MPTAYIQAGLPSLQKEKVALFIYLESKNASSFSRDAKRVSVPCFASRLNEKPSTRSISFALLAQDEDERGARFSASLLLVLGVIQRNA